MHSLNGHSLLRIAARPAVPIATNTAIPVSKVAVSPHQKYNKEGQLQVHLFLYMW